MKNKTFIIALIAAVIIGVWFGRVSYSRDSEGEKTDDETLELVEADKGNEGKNYQDNVEGGEIAARNADWQTYKSEQYGFEIQYPKGYLTDNTVSLKNKEERERIYFYAPDQYAESEKFFTGVPQFTLLVVDNQEGLPLSGWISKKLPVIGATSKKVEFGQNAFQRIFQEGTIDIYVYLIASHNAIYMITMPVYDETIFGIQQQVLSSFAFL